MFPPGSDLLVCVHAIPGLDLLHEFAFSFDQTLLPFPSFALSGLVLLVSFVGAPLLLYLLASHGMLSQKPDPLLVLQSGRGVRWGIFQTHNHPLSNYQRTRVYSQQGGGGGSVFVNNVCVPVCDTWVPELWIRKCVSWTNPTPTTLRKPNHNPD